MNPNTDSIDRGLRNQVAAAWIDPPDDLAPRIIEAIRRADAAPTPRPGIAGTIRPALAGLCAASIALGALAHAVTTPRAEPPVRPVAITTDADPIPSETPPLTRRLATRLHDAGPLGDEVVSLFSDAGRFVTRLQRNLPEPLRERLGGDRSGT